MYVKLRGNTKREREREFDARGSDDQQGSSSEEVEEQEKETGLSRYFNGHPFFRISPL